MSGEFTKCHEEKKESPFDYVAYDDESAYLQAKFKSAFNALLLDAEGLLKAPRAKALVKTKLEEGYMWVGKAIRDDQLARTKHAEFNEGRGNA